MQNHDGPTVRHVAASGSKARVEALEAEIEDLRRTFEYIMEASLAGWWDWRIQDGTEYLSPSFKRLFGYADDEMENTPEAWQEIIFEEDLPTVFDVFNAHIESKGAVPYDNKVRYRHKDGRTVWVYCRGKVVEWDGDKPVRMLGNHVDITQLVDTEQELASKVSELASANDRLAQANREVEATNRDLERFAYVASHDLQTPLRHMAGFVGLIERTGPLNEKQLEYMQKALAAVTAMQDLTDGLLTFARSGTLAAPLHECSLREIAEKAAEGLEIDLVVEGDARHACDARLLGQVFSNLFRNSAAHGGVGKAERVTVRVALSPEVIEVEDDGVGFGEGAPDDLFEMFARGAIRTEGSGLGLAICRRVVEAHGWAIRAVRDGTPGARFVIDTPGPL